MKCLMISTGLDYVVQGARFQILEGFGCSSGVTTDGLSILLVYVWSIIPPLVSAIFYYRTSANTDKYMEFCNDLKFQQPGLFSFSVDTAETSTGFYIVITQSLAQVIFALSLLPA